MVSVEPYVFSRKYIRGEFTDQVLVGLELEPGKKILPVKGTFPEGTRLYDYYSGTPAIVKQGKVTIDSPENIVLLGKK
jgi:alpha-amylase